MSVAESSAARSSAADVAAAATATAHHSPGAAHTPDTQQQEQEGGKHGEHEEEASSPAAPGSDESTTQQQPATAGGAVDLNSTNVFAFGLQSYGGFSNEGSARTKHLGPRRAKHHGHEPRVLLVSLHTTRCWSLTLMASALHHI